VCNAAKREAPCLASSGSFDRNQFACHDVEYCEGMDLNVVFKCPRTGMNVQHSLDQKLAAENSASTYEAVVCKACAGLHFINRLNGKLLGQD
jgi:hypothetical protein